MPFLRQQGGAEFESDSNPFGALTVDYQNTDGAYALSGLPLAKSIRRLAFSQPLIMAYASQIRFSIFHDVNVLRSMLQHKDALGYLKAFRDFGFRAEVAFRHLVRKHGETAVWGYLKGKSPWALRGSFCVDEEEPSDIRELSTALESMDALSLREAFAVMPAVLRDSSWGWNLEKRYEYAPKQRELEGAVDGFVFALPQRPLDVVVAGAKLGNCLASYAASVGVSTTVFLIYRGGREVGAVQVDLAARRVEQAAARYNGPLSDVDGLDSAFDAWRNENGLSYTPLFD